MDHNKSAILATICYSDIFDYPLTKAQIWRYLVPTTTLTFDTFGKIVTQLPMVKEKHTFFYLMGRSGVVEKRLEREIVSEKKIMKAKKIFHMLMHIPTIQLIGISGSLAMHNADRDADIDLFIITSSGTLWITRLIISMLLHTMHMRRRRGVKKAPSKICVNMLIDTHHLSFPKERQDFYTAHEILQMKTIFSRGYTYEIFLQKNKWTQKFLPHAFPRQVLTVLHQKERKSRLAPLEYIVKILQVWYMKRHRTQETIREGFVAFHPYEYRAVIMENWEKRKKKYGIQI